jgi:hypothetical protein
VHRAKCFKWEVIPSYGCGQMDKWKICLTQNNVRALWGMFMKSLLVVTFI